MLAPALAAAPMVAGPMPPSTSMSTESVRPSAAISARSARILGSMVAMYCWPPKPGLTVMISTMSTRSSTCATAEMGVAGFNATDAFAPSEAMLPSVRCRWGQASACTIRRSHPASMYWAAMLSGVSTIRCASNGNVVCALVAAITSGPNVRLGTNWPSMTSHWMRSTPAASKAATSSPRRAKSAGSTLGAISILGTMRG